MAQRFRAGRQVHSRSFEGEVVILHLGVGDYFSLDAVGALVWERLAAGRTPSDVVTEVIASYEVDEHTARDDVTRLIASLVAAGLLQESE